MTVKATIFLATTIHKYSYIGYKNSASLPVMCYLIDFIDTGYSVHNFIRRTKLISSFFKVQLELIISKITKFIFRSVIFHSIFWKCNSLILGCFQALSTLRWLELLGFHFWTPLGGLHHLGVTPGCFWIS